MGWICHKPFAEPLGALAEDAYRSGDRQDFLVIIDRSDSVASTFNLHVPQGATVFETYFVLAPTSNPDKPLDPKLVIQC